jgi:LysM repeat protein
LEVELPAYVRAKQLIREGNHDGALAALHEVIDSHRYCPESHLEAGLIYLQQEEDAVLAIYHFRRYLELSPSSREAPLVEELIERGRKQFAASLPANPFKEAASRIELLETIAGLKRKLELLNAENLNLQQRQEELSAQLASSRDALRSMMTPDASELAETEHTGEGVQVQPLRVGADELARLAASLPSEATTTAIPLDYEVKPGDSLYAISVRFYGSSEKIQAIFQANREVLRSVNDLKPGQILKLPR